MRATRSAARRPDVALRAVMKLNAYDAMVALRSLSRGRGAFQELYEKVRTRYAEE